MRLLSMRSAIASTIVTRKVRVRLHCLRYTNVTRTSPIDHQAKKVRAPAQRRKPHQNPILTLNDPRTGTHLHVQRQNKRTVPTSVKNPGEIRMQQRLQTTWIASLSLIPPPTHSLLFGWVYGYSVGRKSQNIETLLSAPGKLDSYEVVVGNQVKTVL